eukprot:CAMPEP_0172607262 /NCGR_PEP_ID=MMETSP1068-20121228/27463_1 /TAXON_ID=35684 /ORGANISM="Pseudopedinella elastica, Strain CCMP716" /LENGTH=384 /DNA_ID=CAMNT_0013410217 /DNA_START=79 /DNA_END=1234 /DNA_ORIENTATION=+
MAASINKHIDPSSSSSRSELTARLGSIPALEPDDPLFKHGRGAVFLEKLDNPVCTWRSKRPPRDDHEAEPWLTASEFQDSEKALDVKAKELARMIRMSKKTVLYTGAGISAQVIGQAARSGSNKQGWMKKPRQAKPTFTHCALGLLGRQGLVHGWIQQNHDGLPQKAGFPQECINEIHGSWYDPSNPVVKYSGDLHDSAYPWMVHDANTADLVIVLGTSLGGLNADQVATKTAKRSMGKVDPGQKPGLGTVCINLQQTPQDGIMSLRLFGRSDEVLMKLLAELDLSEHTRELVAATKTTSSIKLWPNAQSKVLVPYDKDGHLLEPGGEAPRMWLDLRSGKAIRLTETTIAKVRTNPLSNTSVNTGDQGTAWSLGDKRKRPVFLL